MRRLLFLLPALALAQPPAETTLENDQLILTIRNHGGAFTRLVRKDDPRHLNPLWTPARPGTSSGHFLCLDGFGPTSPEERAAGLEGHGEAHRVPWQTLSSTHESGRRIVTFTADLPLVHEHLERSVELRDGESVIAVDSALTSGLAFDRPINWAEHATIGYPFLAPGETVVDASVGRCQVRPNPPGAPRRTLEGGAEFRYPFAPLAAGGLRDLREVPAGVDSLDHTGCAIDPASRLGWVTAIHRPSRLLLGYLFRRDEYPWLQEWLNYPSTLENLSRGLEFGTQPYDVPRREAITQGSLFGVPAFRWLPAAATIRSRFLFFYVQVPEGFDRVEGVTLAPGALLIAPGVGRPPLRVPTAHSL